MVGANGKTHIGTDKPADGGVGAVHVVPVRIGGLLFGLYRVFEANAFKRLVPLQHTRLDGSAVFDGNVLVQPVHNRLHGL